MTNTLLVEQRVIFEEHMISSRKILRESCSGLTREQRIIVEGIYNESKPLIEASLTADQIQSLFGAVEKNATAAGGNRTMLGKAVDIPGKVNDLINKIGSYLQDTTPVKMADQKFEQLKAKVGAKFPELDKQLTGLGTWMKENPGKSAAIIGVLTTLASLAGGPVGGAIAGQFLRGAAELIKGEKLSTAVGKGIKTAVFGYLSGKAFEMLGKFAEGIRIKSLPFGPENAGYEQVSFGATKTLTGPGTEWTRSIQGVDIIVDPEMASAVRSAQNMLRMGGDAANEGFEQLASVAKIINSAEYKNEIINTLEISRQELLKNDSLLTFIKTAKEGLMAASQGAVAASTGSSDKKESVYRQTRPLSEGQVYMLFNRVEQLNEGPLDAIKGAVDWVGKKAGNLTTKVTADKLNSAWKAAGSPTDSNEIAAFLEKQGVSADVVNQTFTAMKLPAPGSSAAAAAPAVDIEAVKKMIAALPVDRKARLLKYLQKNADKATPAAEPAAPAATPTPTDPARDAGGGRIEPTMA